MDKLHYLDGPQIRFFHACIIENKLWFPLEKFNGLGYINLLNARMEYVSEIPGEDGGDTLYIDAVNYKDNLILAPGSAKEIAIYNIKNNQFTKIGIKEPPVQLKRHYLQNRKFKKALVVEDSVYFLPNCYPAIVELNLLTGVVHYYDDWVEKIHHMGMEGDSYSANYPIEVDNVIFIASMGANVWLEFDTRSKKTRLSVKEDSTQCCCMAKTKSKWVLIENRSGRIVTYPYKKTDKVKGFKFAPELPERIPFFAYNAVTFDEYVFILMYNDTLLRLDTKTNELIVVRKGTADNIELWGHIQIYQEQILYYDGKTNTMYFYTEKGTLIKEIKVMIPEWFWSKNEESMLCQAGVQEYCERELSLNEYIKLLKIKNTTTKKEIHQTGKNIYSDLRLKRLGQRRKESGY